MGYGRKERVVRCAGPGSRSAAHRQPSCRGPRPWSGCERAGVGAALRIRLLAVALGGGLLARGWSGEATEFGGVMAADSLSRPAAAPWAERLRGAGGLTWARASSPLLARLGFNQVAIVPLPTREGTEPGRRRLAEDLLEVYWACRTNLPAYAGVQQAWEVGNEPDFHFLGDNADRMAAVIKAAYWGIEAANPRAWVLLPSMAFVPAQYQEALAANRVRPYVQGYNFHFYGWAQDFLPSIRRHRQFLKTHDWRLPLWITEAGYFQLPQADAAKPGELARQQAFHERLALSAYAGGVDYYFPFILTPYIEEGCDLALTTPEYSPRPALDSYLYLARHLRGARPLYQLWHRPSRCEVGLVLSETNGNWLTALWTPYRWQDFALPSDQGAKQGLRAARPAGAAASGDLTALEVALQFPAEVRWVQLGLKGEVTLTNAQDARLEVSSAQNVYVRTPPHRFRISDCEWRRWQPGERIRLPRAGGLGLGASRFAPPGPVSNVPPLPSPVVAQLLYDAGEMSPDKPAQTYRWDSGSPVRGRLQLYNFGAKAAAGWCRPEAPNGWRWVLDLASQADAGEIGPTEGLPRSAHPALRVSVAAQSRVEVPFRLVPPPGFTGRARVSVRWEGADGAQDVCTTTVERAAAPDPPDFLLSAGGWRPTAAHPRQWRIEPLERGGVRLVLLEQAPPGELPTAFYVLPHGLALGAEDRLSVALRLVPPRPRGYFRLQLVSSSREVARYADDQPFGSDWSAVDWRVGDASPTFWSHVPEADHSRASRWRFLRLAVRGLRVGDAVEVRDLRLRRRLL